MIDYSYSDTYPQVQHLQGGILYPHGIELVDAPVMDGEKPRQQYRYQVLKFPEDLDCKITDPAEFAKAYPKKIAAYLAADVDVQRLTKKQTAGKWEKAAPAEVKAVLTTISNTAEMAVNDDAIIKK